MQIIPVIDLMNGQVVRAQYGNRSQYQAIKSPLCKGSDPLTVSAALLEKTNSGVLYIADLDAIAANNAKNENQIQRIMEAFPDLTIWLDAGFEKPSDIQMWSDQDAIQCVVGSEMHQSLKRLTPLMNLSSILSLDFKEKQFLGPQALLENVSVWPKKIIVMTLSSVGSNAGPDFNTLEFIQKLSSESGTQSEIFAAGGVRHRSDLARLESTGISGVLVASALHSNQI